MAARFIDTNVIVYIASGDSLEADRAEEIVVNCGTIRVPVSNELANVARRKMGLFWADMRSFLSSLRALLSVEPNTAGVHDLGRSLAEQYGVSVYDAMIAA